MQFAYKLLILISIFYFVNPLNYTSVSPTWLTSNFFRAGNEAVINSLTGNSSTPRYTFTFTSAMGGVPNLAYGIKQYRGKICLI